MRRGRGRGEEGQEGGGRGGRGGGGVGRGRRRGQGAAGRARAALLSEEVPPRVAAKPGGVQSRSLLRQAGASSSPSFRLARSPSPDVRLSSLAGRPRLGGGHPAAPPRADVVPPGQARRLVRPARARPYEVPARRRGASRRRGQGQEARAQGPALAREEGRGAACVRGGAQGPVHPPQCVSLSFSPPPQPPRCLD